MLRRALMAASTFLYRPTSACIHLAHSRELGAAQRAICIARRSIHLCSRGRLVAGYAVSGVPQDSVDEILEGISDTGFSARTVDYDADSDSSSDEFGFTDEQFAGSSSRPAARLDGPGSAEGADADLGEGGGFDEEEKGEVDEDEEPPLPSPTGEGPLVEYPPGTAWAEPALAVAQRVLSQPGMAGLELYSFRAAPVNDRLYVRLDKMEDVYGSPSMDDVTEFSREFYPALEAALGEEAAGKLQIEVSSPGAERRVRVPGELLRFQRLPMQVTYQQGAESDAVETRVLQLLGYDEATGTMEWGLADVKANRQKRLGRLTKKETQQRFSLPVAALRHVNLHLDL